MDNIKLTKEEEALINSLSEGLESLIGKLSTTECNYLSKDVIACNTALKSITADGFYSITGNIYYYCCNHDVATGKYECPYADIIENTICCTVHECNHKGIYEKPVVDNSLEDEIDVCLSCTYYKPEAPDYCTYASEACYYDTDPDTYPF